MFGLYIADDVQVHLRYLDAADGGIGRDIVDVEFQGVGAGLLDHAGILDPAARRHAVQAADDRECWSPPWPCGSVPGTRAAPTL